MTTRSAIRQFVAAIVAGGALTLAPIAVPAALAAPAGGTETHSVSTWDPEIVMYTYGFAAADTFKGTTLQMPLFDPVVGGVHRELTGVSFDYQFIGDSGRTLANWTSGNSVVDSYKSTYNLTLTLAGEPFDFHFTWFDKVGPFVVEPHSEYDLGSLGPRESGSFAPGSLSPYIGSGDFPVKIEASSAEEVVTDGRGAYAQGWESGGITVTVTYTYKNLTTVTPAVPSLNSPDCGQTAEVVLPETAGVEYTKTVDGDTVQVVATANDGYILADGATSTWSLTIPKIVACQSPVTPETPTLSTTKCGQEAVVVLPSTDGVEYTKTVDGDTVQVVATANDGYILADGATSTWSLTIPEIVACEVVDSDSDSNDETELAWTGADVAGPLTAALGLLGAGAALLATARRRSF